jgi:hypothetical protein
MCRAEVALLTATPCFGRRNTRASPCSNAGNGRALGQEVGAEDIDHRLDVRLGDLLAAVRNH